MRIVRFKQTGSLSREPWLNYTNRFWIEPGTIALQVDHAFRRHEADMTFELGGEKDIVPLIMNDGTKAFAVCAPGGWEPWIEEL